MRLASVEVPDARNARLAYVGGAFDVLKHMLHLLDYHARPTGTPWEGRRVER